MVCEHLAEVERALVAAGTAVTYRGQTWSSNCREWVYFACWLDRPAIRSRLTLGDYVHDHLGSTTARKPASIARNATTQSWVRTLHAAELANISLGSKFAPT